MAPKRSGCVEMVASAVRGDPLKAEVAEGFVFAFHSAGFFLAAGALLMTDRVRIVMALASLACSAAAVYCALRARNCARKAQEAQERALSLDAPRRGEASIPIRRLGAAHD
jgi:hypothetical protein